MSEEQALAREQLSTVEPAIAELEALEGDPEHARWWRCPDPNGTIAATHAIYKEIGGPRSRSHMLGGAGLYRLRGYLAELL